MKRTLQHIIDSKAQKQFEQSIPNEWIIRSQKENDYGIDYEIEIFNNSISTGIIFKVQLKGTKKLKKLKNENISFSLGIEHIEYFIKELNIPTFLIIADIESENTYWTNVLLDRELRENYNKAVDKNSKSITLHIPSSNLLPKDIQLLAIEYSKCMNFISARYLSKASNVQFSNIHEQLELDDKEITNFQYKVDMLKIGKINEHFKNKHFDKATSYIDSLVNSNETNVQTKLFSLLIFEKIVIIEEAGKRKLSAKELSSIRYPVLLKIKNVTKKGPNNLKLFALTLMATNRLQILSQDEFNLFINKKINEDSGDGFWLNELFLQRILLNKKIQIIYRQINRYINIAFNNKYYAIIPSIVDRFAESVATFLLRINEEGLTTTYDYYANDVKRNINNSIMISYYYKEWDTIIDLCTHMFIISISTIENSKDRYKTGKEIIYNLIDEIIADQKVNSNIKSKFTNTVKLYKELYSSNNEKREFSIEEEREVYIRMAGSLGINLNDSNDEIANIVNIGLADLNPERVLKNCQHFYVKYTGGGLPAQWLRLPSAGSKALICTKHGHTICGITLDGLYRLLKNKYCDNCIDNFPHHNKWKWTRVWQQKQDKLYFKKYKLFGR